MDHLYKVRDNLTREEEVIVRSAGFEPNETLWCHGVRTNAHGSYGRVVKTYCAMPDTLSPSPNHRIVENFPMRYLEEIQ